MLVFFMPAVVFLLIGIAGCFSEPSETLKSFANAGNYLLNYPAVLAYAFVYNMFLFFWIILMFAIVRRKRWAFISMLVIMGFVFINMILDGVADKFLLGGRGELMISGLILAGAVMGLGWWLLADQMDE